VGAKTAEMRRYYRPHPGLYLAPNQYQNALLNLIASSNCTHGKNTIYESKLETNDPDLPSQQKALDWYWALLQL
jgi:hypothetical protein